MELKRNIPSSAVSVAFTTTVLVDSPCASVGVHATLPDASTVIPTGPLTNE